uniref:NADH-ubiquinone oxidoreductase chain 6 n=1 Tax=Agenocimbex maculatus TaxID=2507170 RepID=A0A977XS79_9HYME|nr:NADH dehydrogenase subunit 6 [Agenocimbex maculatus]
MTKMLLLILLMNSFMFIVCKNPFSMGLMLLTQTVLISINSGISSFSFWYSYVLFMIMLGGMLVLFIYMTSLTSNSNFKFNKNLFILMMLTFLFMITFMAFLKMKFNLNLYNFFNPETESNYLIKLSLKKMFYFPNFKILLLVINYLLLTLFIVVKIININKGPLRKI